MKKDQPQLFYMGSDPTKTIQGWVKNAGNPTSPYSATSDTSEASASSSTTSWIASAKVGIFSFITFGGEGGMTHTSSKASAQHMKVTFKCEGLLNIPIITGDINSSSSWYQAAVISEYCGHLIDNNLNKWAPKSLFAGSPPQRKPYGPDGFAPYWPVGVTICFRPTIILEMDTSEYNRDATSWSAAGSIGVSIGSFRFGGSGSVHHDEVHVSTFGDRTSIVLTDGSDIPKALCFQMQLFPPNRQR